MRALLVVLAACGGAQSVAPPPPPTLVVTDAGTEPRRLVRFELPATADAHAEAHMTLSITRAFTNTVLENAANSVTYPELALSQHWHVRELLPDGSARIQIDTEAVRAGEVTDPKLRREVAHAVDVLSHQHASFRLFPDGTRTEEHTTVSEFQVGPELGMIFPPTPIGIGAEWKVTQLSTLASVHWRITYTYHLRALDDTAASVEVETSAIAPEQALTVDPKNSTTLTTGKITGGGQYLFPLHALVPTGGSSADSFTAFQLVRNHLRIETSTHVEVSNQIRPTP